MLGNDYFSRCTGGGRWDEMNTGTRLRCLMGSFVGDSLFDSWTDRVCVTPLKRAGDSLPLSGYLGVSRDQCNRGDCGGNYFYDFICAGHGWHEWRVGDAIGVALAMMLVMGGLGAVLNGSNPVWQANLWLLVWAIVTFAVVSRVRKNFRFYAWYKGELSMAAEGLASLIFVFSVGIYYLGMGQFIVGGLCVAISAFLIYKRVGRRDATLWGKLVSVIRRK